MALKRLSIVVDEKLWSDKHEDQMNCLEQALINASGWPHDYPAIMSPCLPTDGSVIAKERKEALGPYLTNIEQQMTLDYKLLQIALGIRTCKTIGEVTSLLREVYDMDRQEAP